MDHNRILVISKNPDAILKAYLKDDLTTYEIDQDFIKFACRFKCEENNIGEYPFHHDDSDMTLLDPIESYFKHLIKDRARKFYSDVVLGTMMISGTTLPQIVDDYTDDVPQSFIDAIYCDDTDFSINGLIDSYCIDKLGSLIVLTNDSSFIGMIDSSSITLDNDIDYQVHLTIHYDEMVRKITDLIETDSSAFLYCNKINE